MGPLDPKRGAGLLPIPSPLQWVEKGPLVQKDVIQHPSSLYLVRDRR